MKENFDFLMPSVNFFGKGVIKKIGDRAKMLNMKKPLIVTDKFLRGMDNGPVAQTLGSLDAAGISTSSLTALNQTLRFEISKQLKKFIWIMTVTVSSLLVAVRHMIVEKEPELF